MRLPACPPKPWRRRGSFASVIGMETQNIRIRLKAFDHRVLDQATGDMFNDISRTIDKSLWFLEEHLQVQ